MPERVVLHVDMDAFFASVEQRDHPELRGRPVVVGHDGPRGVVAAASYEARRFGVRSAQPIVIAKRRCANLVIAPVRFTAYREASERVFAIFEDVAPLVEPLSIDEAFLDLTGTRRVLGDPVDVARSLRARIFAETSLTASVGVAPNKFLAKLASDMDKPDGLTVIPPDRIQEILDPLPIDRLWGVGPATAKRLRARGIGFIRDVRALSREDLERELGAMGSRLHDLSHGRDQRSVVSDGAARSISQECTFGEDLEEPDAVRDVLRRQATGVARRLRRSGLRARTIVVKLRYGDFETITRSRTLDGPTDMTDAVLDAACALFDKWVSTSFRPVRLVGVGASQMSSGEGQLELFQDPGTERRRRLDQALDGIVDRFGSDAIRRGK